MVSIVLSAVRWEQVLHALDLRVPLKRLTSHYFAGQFVSNVLPTTIGGDVLRIARVSRDLGGHRPESVASVVIERLTGWLVLPLISFIGLVVNRGLLPDHGAATAALVINTLALVGLIGVLYLASHQKILGRFARARELAAVPRARSTSASPTCASTRPTPANSCSPPSPSRARWCWPRSARPGSWASTRPGSPP